MCLAVPGKILSVVGEGLARSGEVSFGGVLREVCLGYVSEAAVGDYVVVHAGCAIAILDEEAARQSLEALAEWDALEGPGP
jgi:hydrogenase expression/formation protein HypC